MADDKRGREKQARDAERRQQERDIATELERGDELEPPVDVVERDTFEVDLDAIQFPATGAEVVAEVGDHTVESAAGRYTVRNLVPETDAERFDSPAAVRVQVRRPTVAAAMARVIEASETLPNVEFGWSQRDAYELTFAALVAVDALDDDAGVTAVCDWVVEQIHEKDTLPTSRQVRRHAAAFCRENGYAVRDDEWLGA
ncbi:hypothetical protein EFA46_012450 (plasmid) [Halarchaeum sp. CBA1220]|uniref:DUF5789 family protein n=1 Tax=Halarchaeum sp. CBA1220 TaxID=1853682 RepID=UPI000F3A875E|nr:hypothetical protein [Halarchaeum sp. CBA1220]QLC35061.1 hypothetical protein EFA46_012450 [Halarchaeum sp. CBA1220]